MAGLEGLGCFLPLTVLCETVMSYWHKMIYLEG